VKYFFGWGDGELGVGHVGGFCCFGVILGFPTFRLVFKLVLYCSITFTLSFLALMKL